MQIPREFAPAALSAYVFAVVLANYLTEEYGLVAVGFGLAATAGTYAAGAALLLRDLVQDTCGRVWVVAGILLGAGITYLVSPALATASAVAFLLSELCDTAVYTPLRARGWAKAVIASNVVGAVVDTYVFLWIADFPVTGEAVAGQLVGKLLWATLVPVLVVVGVRRALR